MAEGKARVLVVDDDHEARLLLSTVVARAGFDVNAVADGSMALTMMASTPPDIVLLDAHLPRLSGFDVCKRIREDVRTASIPVVMLTAFAGDDARQRSMDAGATEFVPKPFRADALLELLERLLAAPQGEEA